MEEDKGEGRGGEGRGGWRALLLKYCTIGVDAQDTHWCEEEALPATCTCVHTHTHTHTHLLVEDGLSLTTVPSLFPVIPPLP